MSEKSKPKKILIAEDDQFLANAYRVKFTNFGFDIRLAKDGKEALKILEKFKPDIILLDLTMPEMDGFTTLEKIKQNKKWTKIPILVTSNLSQKEDRDKVLALSARDLIIKSNLSLSELVEKIYTFLK